MPRILVVYYSRTGNTRLVATKIAAALGADLEAIRDDTRRTGIFGYLRSGREAFRRRLVRIAAAEHDPAGYDLVVIGTPVWNVSLSSPVRSFLRRHRSAIRAAAFFCTCGGAGMDRTLRQMVEESGRQPVATLVVRERDLTSARGAAEVDRFAADIRAAMAGAGQPVAKPA